MFHDPVGKQACVPARQAERAWPAPAPPPLPALPPGPEPTRPRGLRAAGSTAGSFLRGPRSPASSLLVSEAARVALLSAWSLKCSPCVYPALHGAPRSPPLLLRTHTHSTPLQTGEPRGPGQTSGWQQRPLRDQRGPSRASRGAPQGGQGSSGAVLAGVILTDVDSCVPPPELFRFRQEPGGQHDAFRPGHPWRPVHGPWAAVGSPHPQPPRRPGAHGLPVLPADLAGVRPRDGPAGGVRGGEDGPGPEWQPPLIPPQARPAPSPPPLFLGGNF